MAWVLVCNEHLLKNDKRWVIMYSMWDNVMALSAVVTRNLNLAKHICCTYRETCLFQVDTDGPGAQERRTAPSLWHRCCPCSLWNTGERHIIFGGRVVHMLSLMTSTHLLLVFWHFRLNFVVFYCLLTVLGASVSRHLDALPRSCLWHPVPQSWSCLRSTGRCLSLVVWPLGLVPRSRLGRRHAHDWWCQRSWWTSNCVIQWLCSDCML